MTIPPQNERPSDDNNEQQEVGSETAEETPPNLNQETIPAESVERAAASDDTNDLPAGLSPEERSRAANALSFLRDVRAAKASHQLPASIGRYTIERSLGRGGFAEVFLAHDPELDRRVALKVPLLNTAHNDEVRQRFEREARLAATLGHPQIVPVYEYGQSGPLKFIAFAWCNGVTLSDWMNQNSPLDFRTCAEIVCHLADAVQHAHQRGIVHRDLKPTNVLVEASDVAIAPVWEQVRITDFGLARSSEADEAVLTQDGRIVGTPAYMSPEQASSQSDVGPAADIWALGMMLFELLTNQLPFRRDDMLATVRAITDEPVPRVRFLRSDVPAGLDAIVDLCLRKAPSDRYDSAHELAEDLRRWLNGEPVHARPLSPISKAVMWMRRNPLPAASIAITFAALGLGLSIALWQRNEALTNLREVRAQTSRADGNLQTAQTLINDIISLEKRLQSQGQLAEERASLIRRAAKLQTELVQDENQTPQVRYDTAISLKELSTLLKELQQFDESVKIARRVLTLLEGLEADLPEGVSTAKLYELRVQQQIVVGSSLSMANKNAEAEVAFSAAEAETIPEGVRPLQRAAWLSEMRRSRAIMLAMKGDRAASAEQIQRGLVYFTSIDPPDDPKLRWNYYLCKSRLHTGLGMDQMALQDVSSAKKSLTEAAEELSQLVKIFPDHPVLADQQMQLSYHRGALAEQESDWKTASEHYAASRQHALTFFSQNRENLNPANFYVMTGVSLCRTHDRDRLPDKALKVAQQTIESADGFPEALKKSKAFAGNLSILKNRIEEAEAK